MKNKEAIILSKFRYYHTWQSLPRFSKKQSLGTIQAKGSIGSYWNSVNKLTELGNCPMLCKSGYFFSSKF